MSKPEKSEGLCRSLPYEVTPEALGWMQHYFDQHPEAKFIPQKDIPGSHQKSGNAIRGQLEDHFQGVSHQDLQRFIEVGKGFCDWQQAIELEWQGMATGLMSTLEKQVPELQGKIKLTPQKNYNQWVIRLEVKGDMAHNDPRLRGLKQAALDYFQKRFNNSGNTPARYFVKWQVAGVWTQAKASLILLPLTTRGTSSQYGAGDGFDGRGTAASTPGMTLRFSKDHLTVAQRHDATGVINVCSGPEGGTICIKNDKGPYGVPREFDVSPRVAGSLAPGKGYFPLDMSTLGIDGKNYVDQTIVYPGIPLPAGEEASDQQGYLVLAAFPKAVDPFLFLLQLPAALRTRYGGFWRREVSIGGQTFHLIVSQKPVPKPANSQAMSDLIAEIHDLSGLRPGWIASGQLEIARRN